MPTAPLLSRSDLCGLQAWYSLRWKPAALLPKQILTQAVEHGLSASGDAGEAAETRALDLAVDPGMDTAETDLLSLAQHIASFANFTAWVLRGQGSAWKRPDAIKLANGTLWQPAAFLDPSERHLRKVFLVSRWDSWLQTALERSWEVAGECSAYGVGMDCFIVEIGSIRHERWVNPFTVGYRHPVSKTLRFRKRDGEDFGGTWTKVSRETDSSSREEWLDTLVNDGVLTDVVHVHSVPPPERAAEFLDLARAKLASIGGEIPSESLTACFDRIRPCPYRNCCPRGVEPSAQLGFVQIK